VHVDKAAILSDQTKNLTPPPSSPCSYVVVVVVVAVAVVVAVEVAVDVDVAVGVDVDVDVGMVCMENRCSAMQVHANACCSSVADGKKTYAHKEK